MFFKHANHRLFYQIKKPKTQHKNLPTIVLLHGIGGDVNSWDFIQNALLVRGLTTITVDLPCHGLSDKNMIYTDSTNASLMLESLLIYLNVKNVYLIGHCYGGNIALKIALGSRINTKALVVINCGVTFSKLASILNILIKIVPNFAPIKTHASYNKFIGNADINIARFISDTTRVGWKYYIKTVANLADYNIRNDLKHIKCPTLIIGGLSDFITPPSKQKDIAQNIKKSTLCFLDTGHISTINARNQLKQVILKFLINHT